MCNISFDSVSDVDIGMKIQRKASINTDNTTHIINKLKIWQRTGLYAIPVSPIVLITGLTCS